MEDRLCAECVHCSWARIDSDGPQVPFCENPGTKLFNHPIGWLHPSSRACPLIELRTATVPVAALAAASGARDTPDASEAKTFLTMHRRAIEIAAFALLLTSLVKVFSFEVFDLFRELSLFVHQSLF